MWYDVVGRKTLGRKPRILGRPGMLRKGYSSIDEGTRKKNTRDVIIKLLRAG